MSRILRTICLSPLILLTVTNASHAQSVEFNAYEEAEYFLSNSAYILTVAANTMEDAVAQVIRFYEQYGWGLARPLSYSGVPLIYEQAPLPDEYKPLIAEVRTRHIRKTMDFLCTRTRGAFREMYLEDRVVVIRKQKDSLLLDLDLDPINQRGVTVGQALKYMAKVASRSDSKVRIRFDDSKGIIKSRMGKGPTSLKIFNPIPASDILDYKFHLESSGSTLAQGLAAVLAKCPVPLYLTLRPDTFSGSNYTHVLSLDSLPAKDVRDVDYTYEGYINRRYRYYDTWWHLDIPLAR